MPEQAEQMSKDAIQAAFDASPFISSLNLIVDELDYAEGRLKVKMPMAPMLERRAGTSQFHGGPIAAFIDSVGEYAIGMLVGGGVPTMNLRIDYLKPAVGDFLIADAVVRRRGRTVTTVDVDVIDAKGSLVAIGRGTFSSSRG